MLNSASNIPTNWFSMLSIWPGRFSKIEIMTFKPTIPSILELLF